MTEILRGWLPADDFTMVPNSVIRDPEVTPRALKVYCWLASHREGWRTGTRTMAEATGMSRNTVRGGLEDLKSARIIAHVGGTFILGSGSNIDTPDDDGGGSKIDPGVGQKLPH